MNYIFRNYELRFNKTYLIFQAKKIKKENILFLFCTRGTFLQIKCTSAFGQESCYFVLLSPSLCRGNIFPITFLRNIFTFTLLKKYFTFHLVRNIFTFTLGKEYFTFHSVKNSFTFHLVKNYFHVIWSINIFSGNFPFHFAKK